MRYLEIKGLNTTLWFKSPYSNNINRRRLKQRMVSVDFLKLWYLVLDNEFDKDLWYQLDDEEQNFLHYCYISVDGVPDNKELVIAVGKKFKKDQERLKVLEGEISAGNLNPVILKEICDIMDKLVESNQISQSLSNRLKERMLNSYTHLKRLEREKVIN